MSMNAAYDTFRIPANAEFYPTPAWATIALVERVKFTGPIWEPAAGDGAIADVLTQHGYEVLASDLYSYGNSSIQTGVDFLTTPKLKIGSVVTNPPFSLAEAFIQRSLHCAEHRVAMLLRLSFLQGVHRGRNLWRSTPLEQVLVFSDSLSFDGNQKISFAWFIWRRGYRAKPTIGWINKAAVINRAMLRGGACMEAA